MAVSEILEQFRKPCICGKQHTLVTDTVYIGHDASEKLGAYLAEKNMTDGVVIADTNTAPAAGEALAEALGFPLLVISGSSHATEIVCAEVQERLAGMTPVPAFYIACGSGSLHDITRYIACENDVPFLSYPTAASVDGFVSGVAAMTFRGTKVTYPSRSPLALFADPAVFANAPERLTASGVGDLLGKYICLADWKISNILTGEYICPALIQIEEDVLAAMEAAAEKSASDKEAYVTRVMEGLVLSGLAIQLCGNSRPASGAEHHLSHFWEMQCINPELPALHGEQVGVGALKMLSYYKEARETFARPFVYRPETVFAESTLAPVYGKCLSDILHENLPDGTYQSSSLAALSRDILIEKQAEVRAVLDALPSEEHLYAVMKRCGCKTTLSELTLPEDAEFLSKTLAFAPYVRNRLTFLKLLKAREAAERA